MLGNCFSHFLRDFEKISASVREWNETFQFFMKDYPKQLIKVGWTSFFHIEQITKIFAFK